MPISARLLLLPAFCLSLAGCGLVSKAFTPKPKPDKNAKPKDIAIGQVEMINPEQHFVLIRTIMQFKLEPGWKLETRPISGPKSVLVITPEQKNNFLSADILEGIPQQGELVVLPPQAGTALTAPSTPGGLPPGTPGAAPSMPVATPNGPALTLPPQQPPSQPPRGPIRAPTGEVLPPPIP